MSPRSRAQRILEALGPALLALAVALPFAVVALHELRRPELRLAVPAALWLLVAVPFVGWVALYLDRRRAGTLLFSRTRDLDRASSGRGFGGYVARHLVHLPAALRIVAIGLVALALARPQKISQDRAEVEGIDIMLVLDVSNSMSEQDLLPDRMTAAKRVLDDFVKRRQGDRMGVTLFGAEAYTQLPLTLDAQVVRQMVANVRLGMLDKDGGGTAIGNALGNAMKRLVEPNCKRLPTEVEQKRCVERQKERRGAKTKVIVLVTDGDDNASRMDPREMTRIAQKLGIRIFTILIGRDADPLPAGRDRFGELVFQRPRYPVNPKLLEEIAGGTGGTPYLATDNAALENRFQQILSELDKSKQTIDRRRYTELWPWAAWPALALVLLEIMLSLTRFRRFP